MFRQLWRVRELLLCLVRRDLIVRYQSSVLGFLWSFARPLALVVIFGVAFSIILRGLAQVNPNVPFGLHLLVGILAWSYLSGSIMQGHWAVLSHANLIKKVKLPVEVFPTATVVGNLINYLLGMLVVFPIVLVIISRHAGFDIGRMLLQVVLFLTVTALLTVLAQALTLFVSAVNVYYRDMESVADVGLQAWFYATPIVYPVSMLYQQDAFGVVTRHLGHPWGRVVEVLYWLNPMTPICVAYRRILLYRPISESAANNANFPIAFGGLEAPDQKLFFYLMVSVGVCLLLYLLGQLIFRRYARYFADEV